MPTPNLPKNSPFTRGMERGAYEIQQKRRYLLKRFAQLLLWLLALSFLLLLIYQGGIGYRERRLFRASIEFGASLNEGKIPAELHKLFAQNGQPLSTNAAVEVVEQYLEWSVTDPQRNREYLIVASLDNLDVYQGELLAYFGDVERKKPCFAFEFKKEYLAQKSLFSVNIRYRQHWPKELNEKKLPQKLRQLFQENGLQLFRNASVEATKQNEWVVCERLFAIKSHFASELNKGRFPEELLNTFAKNFCPMSAKPVVDVKASQEWLLRDGENHYRVSAERGTLVVYRKNYILARQGNSLEVYRQKSRFHLYRFMLSTAFWKNSQIAKNLEEQQGEREFRRFRDFSENFWKKAKISACLIFPALLVTVLIAVLLGLFDCGANAMLRYINNRFAKNNTCLLVKLLVFGRGMVHWLPSIFSAIPPFVTGIFVLQWSGSHLIDQYNFFYGTLCLAAFNVNYFYRRSRQKIKEAYQAEDVLFARSLGLGERIVFRHHVFPRVIRDNLVILRELLPHIVVESIVIEYVFAYGGLLRSALDIITHWSSEQITWDQILGYWEANVYITMVFSLSLLTVAIFAYLCHCLEDYFSPQL